MAGTSLHHVTDGLFVTDPAAFSRIRFAFVKFTPNRTDALSLEHTWTRWSEAGERDAYPFLGAYCFLPALPANVATFVDQIRRKYLRFEMRSFRQLLWIDEPDANEIEARALNVRENGTFNEDLSFAFRNTTLAVGKGYFYDRTKVGLNENADGFTVVGKRITLVPHEGLSSNGPAVGSIRDGRVDIRLPIDVQGVLQFILDVTEQDLDVLDVGLRYFWADVADRGAVRSLRYPIFNLPDKSTLALQAHLDPYALKDPERTHYGIQADAARPLAGIGSYFRTSVGHVVRLYPQPSEAPAPARPARLVFADRPPWDRGSLASTGADHPVYLVPDGGFGLGVDGAGAAAQGRPMLLCGLSGIETVDFAADPAAGARDILTFHPNRPAHATAFAPEGSPAAAHGSDVDRHPLSDRWTTAWLSFRPGEGSGAGIAYWSQPKKAPLYTLDPASGEALRFLPVRTVDLPTEPDAAAAIPIVPHAGAIADLSTYRRFELAVLAPARKRRVLELQGERERLTRPPATVADAPDVVGVTPQGLLATFDATLSTWKSLTLARTPGGATESGPDADRFDLTHISGSLRAALNASQVFLVISDRDKLLQHCSVTYRLTREALDALRDDLSDELRARLEPVADRLYPDLQSYEAALQGALAPSDYDRFKRLLATAGAYAQLRVHDWRFDLSPYRWDRHGTILILKFHDKSIVELVDDVGLWTLPDEFNDDVERARERLRDIMDDAVARFQPAGQGSPSGPALPARETDEDGGDIDLEYFVQTVLRSPAWNGILCLNGYVPLDTLPPQIEGLAAGIDPSDFCAHHVGITLNPIEALREAPDEPTGLTIGNSPIFGLINYEGLNVPGATRAAYDFRVRRLTVLFENSLIASFSSQIELRTNEWFGEAATLRNGTGDNRIILNGVYQDHDGQESYVFSEEGEHVFEMKSQVLNTVEILKAQFVTLVPKNGAGGRVQTCFLFWGTLDFKLLRESDVAFDVFSYGSTDGASKQAADGGLSFSNLAIAMSFDAERPEDTSFAFDPSRIDFDMATSRARPDSLYAHFPLKLTGMQYASGGRSPAQLGYATVDTPLLGDAIGSTWYGLVFDLKLGSLGDLAGKAGLVANLLTAWSPNPTGYSVLVGLRLPFSSGGTIGIEGILALAVKRFQFLVDHTDAGAGYLLKFMGVSLQFMKKSLPPGGTIAVFVFGDPGAHGRNDALGWYAAYAKNPQPAPPPNRQQLPASLRGYAPHDHE